VNKRENTTTVPTMLESRRWEGRRRRKMGS